MGAEKTQNTEKGEDMKQVMQSKKLYFGIIMVIALLLVACQSPAGSEEPALIDQSPVEAIESSG